METSASTSTDATLRASGPSLVISTNEVVGGDRHKPLLGTFDDFASPLAEAVTRQVSEFDLAAYSKEDFTLNMQKKVMRRSFNLFASMSEGGIDSINREQFAELCQYLGRPLDCGKCLDKVMEDITGDVITFDDFWQWWAKASAEDSAIAEVLSTISHANEFQEGIPFQQQQLVTVATGVRDEMSYRVHFFLENLETHQRKPISPWHDIPLMVREPIRTMSPFETNYYNFICEIPKWTRAKFEIATGEEYNPIKQDMKNGVPRFYKHGDMMWNYGAFPQTWEAPAVHFQGNKGDNDPVDCIEIGMRQLESGSVTPVKILGVLGMIDDGEMDWKVIAIAVNDPVAMFLNDIDDVPKYLPGCLAAIREWLRVYKICQGGVENKFVFGGEYQNKAFTQHLLEETHGAWGNLVKVKSTTHFGH